MIDGLGSLGGFSDLVTSSPSLSASTDELQVTVVPAAYLQYRLLLNDIV